MIHRGSRTDQIQDDQGNGKISFAIRWVVAIATSVQPPEVLAIEESVWAPQLGMKGNSFVLVREH